MKFWEFTILLKRGIQDIDRTTSHVNIFKLVMDKFSPSEYIIKPDVVIIGHVILNIGGINSIHGPQV